MSSHRTIAATIALRSLASPVCLCHAAVVAVCKGPEALRPTPASLTRLRTRRISGDCIGRAATGAGSSSGVKRCGRTSLDGASPAALLRGATQSPKCSPPWPTDTVGETVCGASAPHMLAGEMNASCADASSGGIPSGTLSAASACAAPGWIRRYAAARRASRRFPIAAAPGVRRRSRPRAVWPRWIGTETAAGMTLSLCLPTVLTVWLPAHHSLQGTADKICIHHFGTHPSATMHSLTIHPPFFSLTPSFHHSCIHASLLHLVLELDRCCTTHSFTLRSLIDHSPLVD